MAYEAALSKAWSELENITSDNHHSVRFLSDEFAINLKERSIVSISCNIPAKDYLSILILHYLVKKTESLPPPTGEWVSFKQLEGGEGYYPSFKKRVIDTIMRKYKDNPQALFELVERFNAKKTQLADISVVLEPFIGVPILINFWLGDNEFGSDANVFFDKSITEIYCTEDIVVLSEALVHNL
ncbi:MAG: DUF3786 domain-containing protein [Candidatus Omnitrophota bacterium]